MKFFQEVNNVSFDGCFCSEYFKHNSKTFFIWWQKCGQRQTRLFANKEPSTFKFTLTLWIENKINNYRLKQAYSQLVCKFSVNSLLNMQQKNLIDILRM